MNTYAGRAEAAQATEIGTRCVGVVSSPSSVLLREAREREAAQSVCASEISIIHREEAHTHTHTNNRQSSVAAAAQPLPRLLLYDCPLIYAVIFLAASSSSCCFLSLLLLLFCFIFLLLRNALSETQMCLCVCGCGCEWVWVSRHAAPCAFNCLLSLSLSLPLRGNIARDLHDNWK